MGGYAQQIVVETESIWLKVGLALIPVVAGIIIAWVRRKK